MRLSLSLAVCVALIASAGLSAPALGQEETPKPGPEHARLKAMEGTWDAAITLADGTTSKGQMTAKMECGGLWLVSDFQGEFGGQKFQGRGLDGYDPASKKYVAVWVDSMVTRPMSLEGTYDEAAKTLTMTGEGPGLDGKPAKFRNVTHIPDNDRQTFQIFLTGQGGQEVKLMTIEYTRRK